MVVCGVAGLAALPTESRAALTLTTAGTNAQFTLDTVVSAFDSSSNLGPLGIVFPTATSMLVSDFAGEIYSFSSLAHNQTTANGTIAQNLVVNGPIGLTIANGQVYLADRLRGAIDKLSNTGAFQSAPMNVAAPTGLATNPFNGHVYVSSNSAGIYDYDPGANTKTLIVSGVGFDGLTVSTDGKTLYAAQGTNILNYSTGVNGAPAVALQATYAINDSVDGTALGTGALAGNIFVNTNSGNLWEYNLGSGILTEIATNGSRGDFVAVAPDGSMFITQSTSIMSLSAPSGSGFTGGTDVPEPAGLIVFGSALLGVVATRRRPI